MAELNKKQQEAVEIEAGPVLVVAGAGAGKTKIITERIKRLIEHKVAPERICTVTFTNKAAGELEERIGARGKGQGMFIGTFHRLGLLLIKENLRSLSADWRIGKNFSILDEDDSLKLLKESQKELNIDPKQYDPGKFKNVISKMKNRLITVEEFSTESPWGELMKNIWTRYEEKKKTGNYFDFDDLLLIPTRFLQHNEAARAAYQTRWHYLFIDEYQDTNDAQYTLSKILAETHKNIFVVGDVDQAIYSWRGADFRNILHFQKDYPNAQIVTLEENYRSTETILAAANAVILNNRQRLPKNLVSTRAGGSAIQVLCGATERHEAEHIAHKIESLRSTIGFKNMAVLYRTNAQSRILEEVFLMREIPYVVIGGYRFYERREIKDILAYCKLIHNSSDIISLKRILNVPPRGIGRTLMLKIMGGFTDLKPLEKEKKQFFESLIAELKAKAHSSTISSFLPFLLKKIEYRAFINDGTEKGVERWGNVQELLSIAKNLERQGKKSIGEFLEHVSLFSVDDKHEAHAPDRVSLMTMHAAKGLEFEAVFIAGLEEGLSPHTMSQKPDELEEERRLFYVAITRAKTHLFCSLALQRTIFGSTAVSTPSRFLQEIPDHLLEMGDFMKRYEEVEEDIYLE